MTVKSKHVCVNLETSSYILMLTINLPNCVIIVQHLTIISSSLKLRLVDSVSVLSLNLLISGLCLRMSHFISH